MIESFVSDRNLTQAYHAALLQLHKYGTVINCSDYNQKQKEIAMTVNIEKPLEEPMISKCIIGGPYDLQRYIMEFIDGILDHRIGSGWQYTYHERYSKWMDNVLAELRRNRETRRAIISIRDNAEDFKGADPACFQSMQYFIRNDKLDCMVLFRSNDLPEAFFFNAFAIIQLQKKVANQLGLGVGTYTHRSNSMHCYEKDFKMLEGFCNRISSGEDLTYNYIGEWDELMKDEIPNVENTIKSLR